MSKRGDNLRQAITAFRNLMESKRHLATEVAIYESACMISAAIMSLVDAIDAENEDKKGEFNAE